MVVFVFALPRTSTTYSVQLDVFVFGVDAFDVVDDVVEDGLAQKFVLTAEEPEEELQHVCGGDQTFVPQHDQGLHKGLHQQKQLINHTGMKLNKKERKLLKIHANACTQSQTYTCKHPLYPDTIHVTSAAS